MPCESHKIDYKVGEGWEWWEKDGDENGVVIGDFLKQMVLASS